MKFENTKVWGFEHAIRGMRNPKDSWHRSDSIWEYVAGSEPAEPVYVVGKDDMRLAQQLIRLGSVHRKFMRQIMVSVDITAPIYW